MKIGYLMSMYPMTSTTFIRREIEALERIGFDVRRLAIRRWDTELVDPLDIAEVTKTQYLLTGRTWGLVSDAVKDILTNLFGFSRGLYLMLKIARSSNKNLLTQVAYFLEAVSLRRITAREGISHLHVHFSTNATTVAMLAKIMGGASYSFTAHGPDEFVAPAADRLDLKIEHATFAVAISNYCRAQITRFAGTAHWNKIKIVRCGVDVRALQPDTSPPTNNSTFVCVGRLCPEKGQYLLPLAVQQLRERFPELKIVLIGDGPLRQQIEDLITSLDLRNEFELRGWQAGSDVAATIRDARALILPTFAEGLPVVIMEALALGKPVISTYIAGIPELLDANCGWIVPAGKPDALAVALAAALESTPEHIRALGLEGRRRVEREHDLDNNAARLAELLRPLAVA